MAKNILFRSPSGNRWIKRNTTDDVLDVTRFKLPKGLTGFRALFDTRSELEGRRQAKLILARMLQLMAEDLVERNDCFVLPKQDFGFMVIGDVNGMVKLDNYTIDPFEDKVRIYGGKVMLTHMTQKLNGGKKYLFRLITPWMRRVYELQSTQNFTWT